MAAVRGGALRPDHRRRRGARRARPVPRGAALAPDAHDVYAQPRVSAEHGSLFEHCVRAIERGAHRGRPRPAAHGERRLERRHEPRRAGGARREHVARLLPPRRARRLRAAVRRRAGTPRAPAATAPRRARLAAALERTWDGEWYRRGYYDDGTPLGSAQNDECRIDSIAQSWAVLSGRGPGALRRARDGRGPHAPRRGARRGSSLLLTPPFDRSAQDPGYIKGYPPGVRENGGQYTHAAAWIVMALAKLGSGDEAAELFHMLNPINHTRTGAGRRALPGRAVRRRRRRLRAPRPRRARGVDLVHRLRGLDVPRRAREHPRAAAPRRRRSRSTRASPPSWPEYAITWRFGRTRYEISVTNPERRCRGIAVGAARRRAPSIRARSPLVDDGAVHEVRVVMGAAAQRVAEAVGA